MLRYVTTESLPQLNAFCRKDPFGCKIASLALAYGLETTFAGFWIQTNEKERITAVLSKLEDTAVLYAQNQADAEEIRNFLSIAGVQMLLYPPQRISLSRLVTQSNGPVMRLTAIPPQPVLRVEHNPPLREMHALLCACAKPGFVPPSFPPFYVDMSHRIRHNTARTVGIRTDGRLCSCACTISETEISAVLGAVATHPKEQRRGLGKAAVSALSWELREEGKDVYLLRSQDENQLFYENIGFTDYDIWEEAAVLR